jgi:hypothetical protein
MSKIGKGPNLNQGEGGARRGSSGSHLEQGKTGAFKKGPSGSHLTPNVTTRKSSGSHLDQQPSNKHGKHAAERGGHSRTGYDHSNPTAGKSKSGSKFKQHPNNRSK